MVTNEEAKEISKLVSSFKKESKAAQPRELKSPDFSYLVRQYRNVIRHISCWSLRHRYLKLVENFLNHEIGGLNFRSEFLKLRSEITVNSRELSDKIEERLTLLPDFYYSSKSDDFAKVIDDLFYIIELYEPDIADNESTVSDVVYGEDVLRSVVEKRIFPILQELCETYS